MADEPFFKIGKGVSDEMFQFGGELADASKRMGETHADVMRWLLSFERCDLSALSTGDWRNLQYELTSFRLHGVLTRTNALAYFRDIPMIWGFGTGPTDHPTDCLITKAQADDFQKVVIEFFEALRTKRPMQFKFASYERKMYFDPTQWTRCIFGETIDRHPRWVVHSVMQDSREAILHWLLEFVKANGEALRHCPESQHPSCYGLFIADRANKHFCSVACQSRAATRRYRSEHGLISGRPRGRPRKSSIAKSTDVSDRPVPAKRRKPHGKSKR